MTPTVSLLEECMTPEQVSNLHEIWDALAKTKFRGVARVKEMAKEQATKAVQAMTTNHTEETFNRVRACGAVVLWLEEMDRERSKK